MWRGSMFIEGFILMIVGCAVSSSATEYEVLRALNCLPLSIFCKFNATKNALVVLKVNNTMLQGIDSNFNTIECNKDHPFSEYCQKEMKGSRQITSNLMMFLVGNPWPELNQSVIDCHVRYVNDGGLPNHLTRVGKIELYQCPDSNINSSLPNTTVNTPTLKPVLPTANEKPNGTKRPDTKSSDMVIKTSLFITLVVCLVAFVVLSVVSGFFVICLRKKHNRGREQDGDRATEEIPMDQRQTEDHTSNGQL